MLVCCLGDIMLDVIVDVPAGLVPDDDTPARITFAAGGQAANVAAWAAALGGRGAGVRAAARTPATVGWSARRWRPRGVEVHGPRTEHPGTVVSLVTAGSRSLASDPGSTRLAR